MKRLLLGVLLLGLLSACAATDTARPIGTGNGMDQLPASPCACEVFYRAGQWLG
ncbi:hypothetical protein [Desertibaculum subflavum]|uniref:hypothetical protein n=1 Tax=Desertibaculum subflavum TaxID=2268458 RepID=UPI0013C4779F